MVSRRYLKSSIIISAHVGVAEWAERLGDPSLAAALLDRLLHKGIVCGIDGPSYRMRSHQARAQALRAANGATSRAATRPAAASALDAIKAIKAATS